jgi:hypothetical protein
MDGERRKLIRSGASERHLFVWIMGTIFHAYVGIASDDTMPEAVPTLPSEVTTLWVAATSAEGFVVWKATDGPWERFVVSSEAFRR